MTLKSKPEMILKSKPGMPLKSTPKKKEFVQEAGAPYNLITSLLIGFPFLAVVAAMELRETTRGSGTVITGTVLMMLGLTLCFYWRRLNNQAAKKFFSFVFIANQWGYMICATLARVIHPAAVSGASYKSVMIACLLVSALISLIFIIAWIVESPLHFRFQALSMSIACAMLIGIITFRSMGMAEVVTGKELILSAHNAISDISKNVTIPSEIKELKTKIAETALAGLAEKKPAGEDKADHSEDVAWGYDEESGPDAWGKLVEAFALCGSGTKQSPIDLPRSAKQGRHVKIAYRAAPMHIMDNGHTIQLSYDAGSRIHINGVTYELKRIQMHSPSEHTINGTVYPMELQLIHTDAKNKIAILSVLLEKGANNAELEKIFAFMPKGKKKEDSPHDIMVDAGKLVPHDKHSIQYTGSLTSPPCSEGVIWNVFKQPMELSEQQIKAFRLRYSGNARPVQTLGGREFD